MEQYNVYIALNARMLDTAIELWTMFAFPSLYLAKRL
jgi:hypothetical protein